MTLFFSMGLANLICIGLYQAASGWFPVQSDVSDTGTSDSASMTRTEEYVDAQLDIYLWVLVGISIFGILLNLFPPLSNFVERLKLESVDDDTSSSVTSLESSSNDGSTIHRHQEGQEEQRHAIGKSCELSASQLQKLDRGDVSEKLTKLEKISRSESTSESMSVSTPTNNSNMDFETIDLESK